MNIVFMGTPDFAVPCLAKIISDGHKVSAVFTREDKPVGRKQILTAPPVKVEAVRNNIPVYQPKKLRDNAEMLGILQNINPDVIVVVAYGRILPKEILKLPKMGCVNVHGSLLPKLRGASPIQWSIVSGETVTGVTTMLMDEGIDTGNMLLRSEVEILMDDTAETLHDKLSLAGAELLSVTLEELEKGTVTPEKQPDEATYAPILTKEMGFLDFTKPAYTLDCLIRGFTPWPLTYFYFEGRRFKVLKAKPCDTSKYKDTGILYEENGEVYISCGGGTSLKIENVCPDGSKKMDASAFLNGRFIASGSKLDIKEPEKK